MRYTQKTKQNDQIPASTAPPEPCADERDAIALARSRRAARSPRVAVKVTSKEDGQVASVAPEHNDHAGWLARLEDAFGSRGTAFAISQLNECIKACHTGEGGVDNGRLNAMLAMIEAVRPADEMQAALAVQMALTHFAVLSITRRALRVDQIPQFDSAGNMAIKLARTFALQAEVLAKIQRGGEQIVKVVHVHPGAQAIVGNVTAGNAGAGGVSNESSNQPHAKALTAAERAGLMPPLWRQDEAGQPVPLARRSG